MKAVTVWTSSQNVPAAVSPEISNALAAFRGQLDKTFSTLSRNLESGESRRRNEQEMRVALGMLEETTTSIVAASIIAEVDAVRARFGRLVHEAGFAERGRIIVFSDYSRKILAGYVWLEKSETTGVDIRLNVSKDPLEKSAGVVNRSEFYAAEVSFELAYDHVLEHRTEIMAQLAELLDEETAKLEAMEV